MQKRITIALGALVLASAPLAAQQKAEPKPMPMNHDMSGMKEQGVEGWDKHMQEHFAGITLTDEQKTKLVAANKLHHGAIDKLKASGKTDDATKKSIAAHEEAAHNDFKAIIGAANFATFEANMKKMDGMMKTDAAPKKP
jgi:hypothetical protein